MELQGKVIAVLPEQRFSGRSGEVVKNAFVIEWSDNGYTQKLCLEVLGEDKWGKMRNVVTVGNVVLCRFGVSSREYNGRWFTSCNCFYCSSVAGVQVPPPVQDSRQGSESSVVQAVSDGDSGLPF